MRLRLLSMLLMLGIGVCASGRPAEGAGTLTRICFNKVIKDAGQYIELTVDINYPAELSEKGRQVLGKRLFDLENTTVEKAAKAYASRYKKASLSWEPYVKYFVGLNCYDYEPGRYAFFWFSRSDGYEKYSGPYVNDGGSVYYRGLDDEITGRVKRTDNFFVYDIPNERILTLADILTPARISYLGLDGSSDRIQILEEYGLINCGGRMSLLTVCPDDGGFTASFRELLAPYFDGLQQKAGAVYHGNCDAQPSPTDEADGQDEAGVTTDVSEGIVIRGKSRTPHALVWACQREWEEMTHGRIYVDAPGMPEYPGGEVALKSYISAAGLARDSTRRGVYVLVKFVVEPDGTASYPLIVLLLDTGDDFCGTDTKFRERYYADRIHKLIDGMPCWTPGRLADGTPVRVAQLISLFDYE